jgi:hypothetical protein
MSAWIVSKKHIDLLVAAAGGVGMAVDNPHEVGQMLWHENHVSVNYRYGESRLTPPYKFEAEPNKAIDPVAVIKQIHCLDYQSCEHEGWRTSAACQFLTDLTSKLEAKLRLPADKIHALPAYNDAPWGIK